MSIAGERVEWLVGAEEAGARLDRFVTARQVFGTRSQVQRLIGEGRVTIDGLVAKASAVVRVGQCVVVERPSPRVPFLRPEAIEIEAIYEDEWLLAINKPAGLVVHPAPGHWSGTLVHALLHRWSGSPSGLDPARCGIVHRLDKDTSGVLVVAKDVETHAMLSDLFRAREVHKEYRALVHGVPRGAGGDIAEPIGRHPVHRKRMSIRPGGRTALTRYRVLERFAVAALVEARPETGRTHQIRVHLASIGHPVLMDPVYSRGRRMEGLSLHRQALHARALSFRHPRSGTDLNLEAPLADDIETALVTLRGKAAQRH